MEQLIEELKKKAKTYMDTSKNEDKILIPFIKELLTHPMKERRKLLPVIKDLQWIKSKYAGYSSETHCDPAQARFLAAVQFVCANKREVDLGFAYVDFSLIYKILSLYCPSWLEEYINDANSYLHCLNYDHLMQLIDMGYINELSPQRIASSLPFHIRIWSAEKRKAETFDSSLLLKREVTLKEHIWHLFEYESAIPYVDGCAQSAYKDGVTTQDESFSAALYRYSLNGQIDRNRLLRTTLSSFLKGFKKEMTGWFAELFCILQPSNEELLSLQEEMMQALTCPYTKPVNVMLQHLKTIATEEGFRYREVIDRVTPLFFSSPKNSLLTIYSIFELIVKQHPEAKEDCCISLCQLFLKKDESLQKKAAAFLLKHGDAGSSLLQDTLQVYQAEMLQSTSNMLAPYLTITTTTTENEEEITSQIDTPEMPIETGKAAICREDNQISLPATKEDFLFQLTRFFDMEESWEIDTTIASIITFHPQLEADDMQLLEPLFQRGYDILSEGWGVYQRLLATFLMEYRRIYDKTASKDTGFLKGLFRKLKEKDQTRSPYDKRPFIWLEDWKPEYSTATCFEPIKHLWLEATRKLEKKDTLPLLSTPTHTPAYIHMPELVLRLAAYQKADIMPSPWDFQLAIARCAIEDKEEAITTARQLLKGEFLNLILFLTDENTQPEPPFHNQTAWFTAGLVKAPDTEFAAFAKFACNKEPRKYLIGNYAWKEPKEKRDGYQKFLQLDINTWSEYHQSSSHQLWQEFLMIKSRYAMGDASYMERLFSSFPNRPEPLVAQIICQYMDFNPPGEEEKRVVTCALRMLLSFHCPLREMDLLLLAGGLLFVDKTARSYAAELWVEGISSGRIDNRRLGEILATLINMGIVPLKRFITQVYESIYKRSTFHNHRLEELLTALIGGLPDKPVTGQKQLLELYQEILTINTSKLTDNKLQERLEAWKANANLKKVVITLLSFK